MSDQAKRRASALATWRLIQIELHRGRGVPVTAHNYLREVCARILGPIDENHSDRAPIDPDPLMLARPAGNQPNPAYTRGVARAVAAHRKNGSTLFEATEAVAKELNRLHGIAADGGHGGSVDAAYKKHRAEIEASDALYAALRAGAPLPAGAIEAILAGPKKRKKPGNQSR